jgi:Mlc titration factor MtfA (ptsG expression regulator)
MGLFKRAYHCFILHQHVLPHQLWRECVEQLAILNGMTAVEKAHLRRLCSLFLYEKNIVAVQGFEPSRIQSALIAAQACLPVLNLGLSCLQGWTDVIVYPGPFRVSRDSLDSAGVVHSQNRLLSGESWTHGPLILSWSDVEHDMLFSQKGQNVVIHEIAHKLDVLNGRCNGYPPLHVNMPIPNWTEIMTEAYENLSAEIENLQPGSINSYAATSPAEFFAVISEYFFSSPGVLKQRYPAVYQQLQLYYRQDPWLRFHQIKH